MQVAGHVCSRCVQLPNFEFFPKREKLINVDILLRRRVLDPNVTQFLRDGILYRRVLVLDETGRVYLQNVQVLPWHSSKYPVTLLV